MTQGKKTILIVDDIPDIREELVYMLKEHGYHVEQADDGARALKVFTTQTIDLLVTDILMPVMDGIELTVAAKELVPGLKVILISGGGRQVKGSSDFDYLETSKLLTNPNYVLKKPFQPEEFLSVVDSLFA